MTVLGNIRTQSSTVTSELNVDTKLDSLFYHIHWWYKTTMCFSLRLVITRGRIIL